MNEAPISTWTVLYTKQKLKKSKTWSDGFLRLMSNRKLVLLDSNQQRLDTFFHKADSVQNGDSLETDAYLIEVDCEFNEHAVNPVPSTNSTALIQLKPVAHASHIASVKKFVPPRVISAPQSAPSNSQSKNILSAVLSGASQNTTRTVALPSTSTTQLASAAPLDDKPAATGERNLDQILSLFQSKAPEARPDAPVRHVPQKLPTDEMIQAARKPEVVTQKSSFSFRSIAAQPDLIDRDHEVDEVEESEFETLKIALSKPEYPELDALAETAVALRKPFSSSSVAQSSTPFNSRGTEPVLIFHAPAALRGHSNPPPPPSRSIPNSFATIDEYRLVFAFALYEEINGPLFELSSNFCKVWAEISSNESKSLGGVSTATRWSAATSVAAASTPTQSCPQHPGSSTRNVVKKDGPNHGRAFYSCKAPACKWFLWADSNADPTLTAKMSHAGPITDPHQRQQTFRSRGIPFYADAQLIVSGGAMSKADFFKQRAAKRFKRSEDGDFDDDDSNQATDSSDKKYFLKLVDTEASNAYSRDDLWIVCADDSFVAANIVFATSLYHGPAASGMIEIAPFDQSQFPASWRTRKVACVRGPNVGSELQYLQTLRSMSLDFHSIVPFILSGSGAATSKIPRVLGKMTQKCIDSLRIPVSIVQEQLRRLCSEFALNDDQLSVIRACSQWLHAPQQSTNAPFVLCHGVFGSGKSSMLIALLVLFSRALDQVADKTVRILVASNTNVAVDRILLGLQEKEFTEFTRVGSLRKIAKPLLRHVLHYSDRSVSSKDHDRLALNELEEMLKSIDTPVSERVHIEAAIVDLKSQITAKRAERLKNMRIVGVTTAAATFDILNDNRFAIVLLDEASQMVEPASLVPLIRFGCERALLIGDPKQLPPTLRRHGSHLHTTDVGTLADTHLSKTMFVRLAASVQPIMLRTQYRLHPHLADLPSKLFYDNVLRNGVTADDRAALIERIPPLSFIEVDAGKETMTAGGSYTNYQEAVMIKQICRSLVRLVDPADIGAISLYKAQAFKIDAELKEIAPGIVCSTVDAFQGAEREIIIISTVRSSGLGFIDSPQRFNVALTRAKRHVVVLGTASNLRQDPMWGALLEHAQHLPNVLVLLEAIDQTLLAQSSDHVAVETQPKSLFEAYTQHSKPAVSFSRPATVVPSAPAISFSSLSRPAIQPSIEDDYELDD